MTEYGAYDDADRPIAGRQVALIDLLDRLLSGGVVLTGDVVLSVADIDLVRISLRAVVVAVREQVEQQWAPILPTRTPLSYGGPQASLAYGDPQASAEYEDPQASPEYGSPQTPPRHVSPPSLPEHGGDRDEPV